MDLHKTMGSYSLAIDAHRRPHPAPYSQIPTKSLIKQNKGVSVKHTVKNAVVIFCDLSKFQQLTAQYGDITCSSIVESLFSQFDEIATSLQLTPLKTNGDQYIAVSFCADDTSSTISLSRCVSNTIEFALKARNLVNSNPVLVSSSCHLRVGIATGDVVARDSARSFAGFDIWGNTVNQAAMLEQFTAPSTIAVCKKTYNIFAKRALYSGATKIDDSAKGALKSHLNGNSDEELPARYISVQSKDRQHLMFYKTQLQTKSALSIAFIC